MKVEKEMTWILTRDSGYTIIGYIGLILRESYKSEKIILKANKSNWDWLEVVSKGMGFYGWQRSEMTIEKKRLYRCRKCKKTSEANRCRFCNGEGDSITYSNGVYLLEPIGALMAYREQILKDSHTLQVIEIIEKAKELQSMLDKQIPKRDFVDIR